MDKNKKYAYSLVVGLIILSTVFLFVFFVFNKNDKSQDFEGKKQESTFSEDLCLASDEENIQKALKESESGYCGCLSDEADAKDCQQKVNDNSYFEQATENLDEMICGEIESDEVRGYCVETVQGSVSEMMENNPKSLGKFYYKTGNHEGAIGVYEKIIEENPSDLEVYPLLSLEYLYSDDLDKAEEKALLGLDVVGEKSDNESLLQKRNLYYVLSSIAVSRDDQARVEEYEKKAEDLNLEE